MDILQVNHEGLVDLGNSQKNLLLQRLNKNNFVLYRDRVYQDKGQLWTQLEHQNIVLVMSRSRNDQIRVVLSEKQIQDLVLYLKSLDTLHVTYFIVDLIRLCGRHDNRPVVLRVNHIEADNFLADVPA